MQNLKLKIRLWTMDCGLWTKRGFTLLEILVVLVVLGFLVAMVAPRFVGFTQEAAITTTLSEMNSIKEAIRDRFYPDLGLIPEDTANPEWAIRFLCLRHDGDVSITWDGASFIYVPDSGQSYQMARFLAEQLRIRLGTGNETVAASQAEALLTWDRYNRRGWQGPYLEREITARDTIATSTEWYPLIIDAWGERVAYSVESDGVTGEYRLIYDELDAPPGITSERERLSARIVSFGPNGRNNGGATTPLPLPADTGDDLVMFIFGTGPIRRP